MSDEFKKFMREFYSPLQHRRLVAILKSIRQFWSDLKWK